MKVKFSPGDVAPTSGIYAVHHREHRFSHEVLVCSGDHFPACRKCGNAVRFVLLPARQADEASQSFATDPDFPRPAPRSRRTSA